MECKELQNKDFEVWDKFVEESPQRNIFSTSKWKNVIEKSTDYKGHILAVFLEGKIVAGCMFFSLKKGPIEIVRPPPLTPFTTILFQKEETDKPSRIEFFREDVTNKIIEKLESSKYKYIFLALHPSVTDIRQFIFKKWGHRVNYTYMTDLTNVKEIWDNLRKVYRKNIRGCIKKGIKIETSRDIKNFYSLYESMYLRKKVKKFPSINLIKNIFDNVDTKLFFAKVEDPKPSYLATGIVAYYKDTVYYLVASSDYESKELKAPSLLWWKIIEDCAQNYSKLDLVGANSPSLNRFKCNFATEVVPYYSVEKHFSKLVGILMKTKLG